MADPFPYVGFEETVSRHGIKAMVRVTTVLQATMPTSYSARGKYQIVTSYQLTQGQEIELSEEQSQQGRALTSHLQKRLEKQMRRAGWSEAVSLSGDRVLTGRNGLTLWEYGGPPPRLRNGEQLVSRRVKMRTVTFTCSACGQTVTQQRFPSHVPKYCSDACKQTESKSLATREKTRLRVAEWRKAHPDARRKKEETNS
jgi:endogenous inhibitor of DNA gyrase (YacG/DUF329 family)